MSKSLATIILELFFILLTEFKSFESNSLKVEVTNFEPNQSNSIWVSVFSKDGFLETPLQTKSVKAYGEKIVIEFDLPEGRVCHFNLP